MFSGDSWNEVARELKERRSVVIATIVRDSGSVPRTTGARMLVYADQLTLGTVGGGLFEALVIRDAMEVLDRGRSETRTYSFNPEGVTPDAFGAVCGGRVDIFFDVALPPDRLLIVGGGHCGRALAEAASRLDFSIVVADDRAEFSRPEDFEFPRVESVMHLPADFDGLPQPDNRTYVALVSKGYVTDEAALRRVIDTPAAYIGMIGSRRKRDIVFERLRADGVPEEAIGRVRSPIGMEIGADSPQEIAIAILAEIIAVKKASERGRPANQKGVALEPLSPPRGEGQG
ncbi:MAG TPA: XdhC/CoxI family protein [Thermoanaerobaculia bacterium]|nr:XdhC/CoxI family protein [Thermoanaerobaculia bacterium]